MNLKLRIGGVPEHFNLPWHLAMQESLFSKAGIDLQWIDYKGGSGAMSNALRDNEIDIAVMLTEAITADIIKGNPTKILSLYIDSPLIWGIHTGMKNSLQEGDDFFDRKFAISRKGSGSHLMPLIDAYKQKRDINEDQLIIVRNLEGAIASLSSLETDVFYWERFITKPFADKGILRCIGTSPTPWPCFVMAAREDIISKHSASLLKLIEVVQTRAQEFKQADSSIEKVCKGFYLTESDAKLWMDSTKWSSLIGVQEEVINDVTATLFRCGIIEQKLPASALLAKI